jgi:hypothetical protein
MIHLQANMTSTHRAVYAVIGVGLMVTGFLRAVSPLNLVMYCLAGLLLVLQSAGGY